MCRSILLEPGCCGAPDDVQARECSYCPGCVVDWGTRDLDSGRETLRALQQQCSKSVLCIARSLSNGDVVILVSVLVRAEHTTTRLEQDR